MIALVVLLMQLGLVATRLLRRGKLLFADASRAAPDGRRRWARPPRFRMIKTPVDKAKYLLRRAEC